MAISDKRWLKCLPWIIVFLGRLGGTYQHGAGLTVSAVKRVSKCSNVLISENTGERRAQSREHLE